jgi:hypothetical protein
MGTEAQSGKIACPHCQALIKAPALPSGSRLNCPKCGQQFRLGEQAGVENRKPKVESQPAKPQPQIPNPKSQIPNPPQPPLPPPPPVKSQPGTANPQSTAANPQSAIRNPQSPSTAPQPNRPDNLVDPNLLPPPPPKQKPKPKEVAVVCHLCGTRVYAPLEKVGQEIKCPDCHTRNVVPPLPEDAAKKSRGPTLEGTEDFGMSEVVERPKYRPLVRERSEYDTLSAVDPASIEHRLTVPGERPRRPRAVVREPQSPESAPREDEEVSLAPPVEVVEAARDPRTILPKPDLEPEDPMYDGRYDDGLIGDFVDPRSTDAWKKAPFLYGIVEFLFFPSTLLRLIPFCMLLAVVAGLAHVGITAWQEGGILVLFVMWGGIPLAAVWLVSFTAFFHAIAVATGNGENEVTMWPDWSITEWFLPCMTFVVATVAALLPGGLIAGATLAASTDDPLMAAFGIAVPPLLSWLILFPVVLHSMLAEDRLAAIASPIVMRSFTNAAEAWLIFYTYSIGLAFLLAGAGVLMLSTQLLIAAVGAAGLVIVLFLYARLIGRLMWYTSQKDAAPAAAAHRQPVRG